MKDTKFNEKVFEVISLLYDFYQSDDESEKRVLRDTIRAIVKELTKV